MWARERRGRRRVHGNPPARWRRARPYHPRMPSATSHLAIYRRWRAQTFGQMVGQVAVVETLRNAVRLDRLSHGFLFVGPRGTGKTSMARILAKAVNCPNAVDGEPDDTCEACAAIREGRALDVVEIDAASNNTVDDMRELLPRVYTATADLRRKVFIIDEVQRINQGWDVLLRTLEDPPDDVLFIFCTTEPSKIRPAVLSRVQRFTFRPLTVVEISGKLERILADEGRTAEPGRRRSGGRPRGRRHARRRVHARPAAGGRGRDAHRGRRAGHAGPGRRAGRARVRGSARPPRSRWPASGCSTCWRPRAATSSASPTRWWSPCGNSSWSASPAAGPMIRPFRESRRRTWRRSRGGSRRSTPTASGPAATASSWS